MEPLERIGAAAREPTGGAPRGEIAAQVRAAFAVGETARVEVLARLTDGVYVVKSGGSALLVASDAQLDVGGALVVVAQRTGRPALLAPAPPDFGALVEAPRAASALGGDVGALLERGATVSAERVRGAPGATFLAVEGARLAVEMNGGVPKSGALVVVRPIEPTRVALVGAAPTENIAPPWFEALVRDLAHQGGARDVGELLLRLARVLREAAVRGPAVERLLARLESTLTPPRNGAELAARLASDGTRTEAQLAAALLPARELSRASHSETLRADMRVAVANALAESLAPNAREALTRALDVLQANALVAAAREQLGTPAWFALPLFDGAHATTAWLRWRREGRRDDGEQDGAQRATLAVEFSTLGPVRVDVALVAQRLVVRLAVAREDVLHELRSHAETLTALLGNGGREVVFGVAIADEESLRIDPVALEHHDAFVDTRG
jgi:hypothetical protein